MLTELRNSKGITLVELLVVCIVIAIAFMGLVGIFPLGLKNINQSRMRTIATDLAQEKMEQLIVLGWTHADLAAGSHTDPDNPVRSNFNRFWDVVDDTPVAQMKRVVVRVTYPYGDAVRDVQLETYVTG